MNFAFFLSKYYLINEILRHSYGVAIYIKHQTLIKVNDVQLIVLIKFDQTTLTVKILSRPKSNEKKPPWKKRVVLNTSL